MIRSLVFIRNQPSDALAMIIGRASHSSCLGAMIYFSAYGIEVGEVPDDFRLVTWPAGGRPLLAYSMFVAHSCPGAQRPPFFSDSPYRRGTQRHPGCHILVISL